MRCETNCPFNLVYNHVLFILVEQYRVHSFFSLCGICSAWLLVSPPHVTRQFGNVSILDYIVLSHCIIDFERPAGDSKLC